MVCFIILFLHRLNVGEVQLRDTAIVMATIFPRQILPNSAAQFVKFREIPRHYPQIPYIPWPIGIVDSTWV